MTEATTTALTALGRRPSLRPPSRQPRSKPRPQAGLALLVLCAAFPIRFPLFSTSASLFDLACVVVAVQLLLMRGALPVWPPLPRRIVGAVAGLLLLSVASIIWTTDFKATLLTSVSWLESIVVIVFVVAVFRDQPASAVATWVARMAVALLVAPVLMYMHVPGFAPPADVDPLSGDYLSYYIRFSHPFIGRSNNIATLLGLLLLPLLWWSGAHRRHRVATALTGLALVGTLSRGVLLCMTVAGLAWLVASQEHRGPVLRRLLVGLAAAGVLGWAALTRFPTIAAHFSDRLTGQTIDSRQDLLSTGWTSVGEHPWLGLGSGVGEYTHNSFVQQWQSYGLLLGSLAIVLILNVVLWYFLDLPRSGASVGLSRACAWGVAATVGSFLFESSLEGVLLRPLMFLSIALLAAWIWALARDDRPVPPVQELAGRRS